jgi:hypothetical protein
MAGLVPAIHAVPQRHTLNVSTCLHRVDGRDKPGHDGGRLRGGFLHESSSPRSGISGRRQGRRRVLASAVKFRGRNVKQRQGLSSERLTAVLMISMGCAVATGHLTPGAAASRRARKRGRVGRRALVFISRTLARIPFFRKNGIGWHGCLQKRARRLPSPCSPSRSSRCAVANANLDCSARRWRFCRHGRCCANRPCGRLRSATIMNARRRIGAARSPEGPERSAGAARKGGGNADGEAGAPLGDSHCETLGMYVVGKMYPGRGSVNAQRLRFRLSSSSVRRRKLFS